MLRRVPILRSDTKINDRLESNSTELAEVSLLSMSAGVEVGASVGSGAMVCGSSFYMSTTMRVAIIATALALSATAAVVQQQPGAAMPFASTGGNCPSGYYLSGGFCTPLNRDSRPAVPRGHQARHARRAGTPRARAA
jgi:hypothetical protein